MIIPTVKVMRPDGKGYHLVNADSAESAQEDKPVAEAPKPARRTRKKGTDV